MQIDSLLQQFAKHQIDYYLIPTTDEFLSEYSPDHLRRLEYVTGFAGSNGIAIIGKQRNALLTDGRYTLQATKQLGRDFEILDLADKDAVTKYLKSLNQGVVGYNPFIFSRNNLKPFQSAVTKLKPLSEDLVDNIWHRKPELGDTPYDFDIKYAGESSESKIKRVLAQLDDRADYILVTEPEAICWLLNFRGNDLKYSPLVLSQLLLSKAGEIELFSPHKSFCGYEPNTLQNIKQALLLKKSEKKLIQVDFSAVSVGYLELLGESAIEASCPINAMKAVKNEVEIQGFREAHKKDGKNLQKFINWLENEYENDLTEYQLAEKLTAMRAEDPDFIMPSFAPIVGYKSNGAVIHYQPAEDDSLLVDGDGMLLIDSGGHYKMGTTDVTRTIYLGEPSAEEKKMFMLVYKGQRALSEMEFKEGTTGGELDKVARQFLVAEGYDYPHGTGHGVGHVLSVHEGPCRIGKGNDVVLEAGMVLSNEPGFYKAGEYGMRHEDLVVVVPAEREGYLRFETLTDVGVSAKLLGERSSSS